MEVVVIVLIVNSQFLLLLLLLYNFYNYYYYFFFILIIVTIVIAATAIRAKTFAEEILKVMLTTPYLHLIVFSFNPGLLSVCNCFV